MIRNWAKRKKAYMGGDSLEIKKKKNQTIIIKDFTKSCYYPTPFAGSHKSI